MDCQQIERLIVPYIENELADEQLEQFLEHVETCKDCQEELEINFMVALGLKQLDDFTENYNIKEEMAMVKAAAYRQVQINRIGRIIYYVVNTLCAMGVLTVLLLQLRIWFQQGIF